MNTLTHHLGQLTEDSVARMLSYRGALFISGLTCFECGSSRVVGTLNHLDYPVATGHAIAKPGAKGTVVLSLRVPPLGDLRNPRANHI